MHFPGELDEIGATYFSCLSRTVFFGGFWRAPRMIPSPYVARFLTSMWVWKIPVQPLGSQKKASNLKQWVHGCRLFRSGLKSCQTFLLHLKTCERKEPLEVQMFVWSYGGFKFFSSFGEDVWFFGLADIFQMSVDYPPNIGTTIFSFKDNLYFFSSYVKLGMCNFKRVHTYKDKVIWH